MVASNSSYKIKHFKKMLSYALAGINFRRKQTLPENLRPAVRLAPPCVRGRRDSAALLPAYNILQLIMKSFTEVSVMLTVLVHIAIT